MININDLVTLIKGNPQEMYDRMVKENPQFAQFVEQNKNRNPEDVAKEHGIDPALLSLFMK